MQQKTSVLFDLDGTLIDPLIGITTSVQYALGKSGVIVKDANTLAPFIGPPLLESFMEFYNFSHEQAKQAVVYYRENFSKKGVYENTLYPGMKELLASLVNQNRKIFLATSKPWVYAKKILDQHEITPYFTFIGGSELSGERTDKKEVIEYVLQSTNTTPEETVMVGDRKFDIIGAKSLEIDNVGVLYGYGSLEELEEAQPTFLAKSVKELADILL